MDKIVSFYKSYLSKTIQLSLPIILGQLGSVMMGLTDTIMLGQVGKDEVAAIGVANQVYFLFTVLGMGTLGALAPMVASSKGASNKSECGEFLRSGIEMGFLISVVLCLIMSAIGENFQIFGQPAHITEMVREYLRVLNISTIPLMLFLAVKQYSDGLSLTKPAMAITLLAVILNIIFNWVLIYGHLTFPALGIKGAAIGTLMARFAMALMLVFYVFRSKIYSEYLPPLISTFNTRPVIMKLFRMGLPGGLQLFFEVGAFAGAAVFVGWLGSNELAAHQIVLGVAALTYMVAAGLSVAGSIEVGTAFGKNNKSLILQLGTSALTVVSVFMLLSCSVFIFLNEEIVRLFINDTGVVYTASSILLIAGLFQLGDGIQVVSLGILRGIHDVNIPTAITLVAYWVVALPVGYVLAFYYNMGITGVWLGLLIGLTISAILLSGRFYLLVLRNKTKTYAAEVVA